MKLKTIFATTAAVAMLAATPFVQADEKNIELIVNDSVIAEANVFEKDGHAMIPVRKLCETLGMTVGWDDAARRVIIEKMPVYVTFTPGVDGYTFAKTAPMQLGVAPVIVNNLTYVPVDFASEILGGEFKVEDGKISVSYGEEKTETEAPAEAAASEVIATAVEEGVVSVFDINLGEVLVNITEETEITDKDGNKADASAIEAGMKLNVVYSDAMTLSLPAQANGIKIRIASEAMYTVVSGTVSENGEQLIIKDAEGVETALNAAEDVKVITENGEGKIADIKAEDNVVAVASLMATRSIPAQRTAYTIIVR